MRPGERTVQVLGGLCLLAMLVPVWKWALPLLLAGTFALVVAAVSEAFVLRSIRVESERPEHLALALGEWSQIGATLHSTSTHSLHLEIRQVWPLLVESSSERMKAIYRSGDSLPFVSRVRATRRGTVALEPPYVAATIWRFMERTMAAGRPTRISVVPNTKAVTRLQKQLNAFVLRGLGSRVAPRLGKGREFDRLRDYVTDDDYRDIAWRATARHGRLIVREFRLDRSQEIMLCLDRGHRMAARVGSLSRLDHAVNATLLLSYICDRMEDKVGLLSFADRVEKGLAPSRGSAHQRNVAAALTAVQYEYRYTDYVALAINLRRMLTHRSLIIMLTVLPEPEEQASLVKAVRLLAPQHLPLILVLTDPELKVTAQSVPATKRELCRTLVARELWEGRSALMGQLRHRGALVVETKPEDTSIAAVNAYIDVKRRQLL